MKSITYIGCFMSKAKPVEPLRVSGTVAGHLRDIF